MRTNFIITCLVALLSATALRSFSTPVVPPNYEVVIQDYIESQITSNYKKLNNVLAANCTLDMSRGNSLIEQSKEDLVNFMKTNVITQQDCSSSYQVLAKSNALIIAVVDFKHQTEVQENFLTIEKTNNLEWKITRICKVFTTEKSGDTGKDTIAKTNSSITPPFIHSRI
jgi:capsular polysaccharide biosynthesis protein